MTAMKRSKIEESIPPEVRSRVRKGTSKDRVDWYAGRENVSSPRKRNSKTPPKLEQEHRGRARQRRTSRAVASRVRARAMLHTVTHGLAAGLGSLQALAHGLMAGLKLFLQALAHGLMAGLKLFLQALAHGLMAGLKLFRGLTIRKTRATKDDRERIAADAP